MASNILRDMGQGKAGMTAGEFRRLRVGAGLTQEQAAPVLGVVTRTVARWEADRAQIGILQAEEIRRRLLKRARTEVTKRS
jgi:DNA-binding transcriptional regulator YiaG